MPGPKGEGEGEGAPPAAKPCRRCKKNPATLKVRLEAVCETCYGLYVNQKIVKRMTLTLKEIRATQEKHNFETPRYLFGLSFGASSAGLLRDLHETLEGLKVRNPRVAYDILATHIDTDLSGDGETKAEADTPATRLAAAYRTRFPLASVDVVPLTAILDVPTMDWSALPPRDQTLPPRAQLRKLLSDLPSITSRVDILRIFIRHLLLSTAMVKGCSALLLGSTTTALAEVTLAEAAKGRGFAAPWLVSDGAFPFPIPTTTTTPEDGEQRTDADSPNGEEEEKEGGTGDAPSFPVYYPLRDVFRHEIVTYNSLADVALIDLVVRGEEGAGGARPAATVVSHKEVSIEDIMARHFAEVEVNYPNVVANVVRTTEKLSRARGDESCGICGMPVDAQGNERWRGELGETREAVTGAAAGAVDGAEEKGKGKQSASQLCYGCERSIRG